MEELFEIIVPLFIFLLIASVMGFINSRLFIKQKIYVSSEIIIYGFVYGLCLLIIASMVDIPPEGAMIVGGIIAIASYFLTYTFYYSYFKSKYNLKIGMLAFMHRSAKTAKGKSYDGGLEGMIQSMLGEGDDVSGAFEVWMEWLFIGFFYTLVVAALPAFGSFGNWWYAMTELFRQNQEFRWMVYIGGGAALLGLIAHISDFFE